MAGLLTRLAALALTIDMVLAIVLVAAELPLISGKTGGAGPELNLILTGGFLVALFAGPGRFSLDRALGIDGRWARPFGPRRA